MNIGTLCWNCNAAYSFADMCCPACGATNPNQDLERAQAEVLGEQEIRLPALLREQAA